MKPYRNLNGYVLVYLPSHPKAVKSGGEKGYVYEHVLVAEKFMGRALTSSEHVHHLDFNRGNNLPANLLVIEGSQHSKLHNWLRKEELEESYSCESTLVHRCKACEGPLSDPRNICCSNRCSQSLRRHSVSKEYMSELIESGMPWIHIGKALGVSDNGARKIARRLGLLPEKTKGPVV